MESNKQELETKPTITEDDLDFFDNGEEVRVDNIGNIKEPKIIPSYTESELNHFTDSLDNESIKKAEKDKKLIAHLTSTNDDVCMCCDIGHKTNYKQVTNDLKHNDIPISAKREMISKRAKSATTGLIKLKQKVGIGTPQPIPLYHSGFWVKIEPMTKEQIVNLEFDIIDKLNTIGKQTNTLAFSHKEVLFAEVILNLFEQQLLTTSLDLGEEYSIKDFIHINDIPIIAWYIATTMYPNGFNALIPCKESISKDDKSIPKCSNILKLKIDMEELIHVDKNKLTLSHLDTMSKKGSRSVSIEEVVKYQETLPNSGLREFRYTTTDDEEVVINVMSPDANKYITYGQNFIELLELKTNNLIKDRESLDRETATETILKLIELTTYNHYIDSIPIDDVSLTDISDINEALIIYNDDIDIHNKIFKDIKKYIDDSVIASIGIPSYTCKSCKTEQTTTEYIPIAVYNYFFTLLHLRYTKIASQLQKMSQREDT